jgi:hypothetical protein
MLDDDIESLFERYDPPIIALGLGLVATVRDIRPDFAAKVAFGWSTVNFRHAEAGFVCAVYPSRDHVSLIFQNGRLLDHPLLTDDGKVKRVRWIPFAPGDEIPTDDIAILLAEAVALRS